MRQTWTGCILLLTALGSSAATLGRHSGAAVIGQPLDVRVQVLLAPGEDLTNQCLNADVFFGDTQVSPGLVRSTPQKAEAESSVRIQTRQPINEPIVTLYVRAGCGTAFTRRFVLLADPLNEPMAPVDRSNNPVAVTPPAVAQAPSTPAGPGVAGGSPVESSTASARPPVAAGPVASPSARPAPKPAAKPGATASPRASSVVRRPPAPPAAPRLQLDPIDLDAGIERDPTLKLSPFLLSEPATSEEARAAAGLLWKSLSASPEDILRDAQKLAALEAEAEQLRNARAQSQNSIGELNAQLNEARDQRYRNWLVYLLGALLLLTLLALLMASRRRPAQAGSEASRAWWSSTPEDKTLPAQLRKPVRQGAPTVAAPAPGGVELDLHLDQDSSLDDLQALDGAAARESDPQPESAVALPSRDRRDFSPSALGISRSVATEELFDIQQQADFFVSLGEDEQAIQVLRNHLAESHEPSPLAYLDLFKLYHRLGRREDYDALRDEFNHVFNAGAPPFNRYTDGGRGLEAYETAFSRIQSLWPEPRVLDLIEESIFRDASDDEVEVFDLEAYRELLLLHAMAKELIKRDEPSAAKHSEFRHTNMQPLKADGRRPSAPAGKKPPVAEEPAGGRNTQPMDLGVLVPASSHLGLDINLNDLSEFSAFEALLPEVSPPVEPTAKAGDAQDLPLSNLIDFEVLDFMPPDDEPGSKPDGKR
ncbi:FimV family protein [Hydrogenophaga sp. ANAO-22]|uniref:type IV pilus assembly protein FimV n=1 Tax=Hydrogenophaga sp. ANAO-22 TaxID=3166645 RepID=UPI0036D2D894